MLTIIVLDRESQSGDLQTKTLFMNRFYRIPHLPEYVGQQRQPPPDQLSPLHPCEALQAAVEDEAAGVHGQGGQEGAPGPAPAHSHHRQVDKGLAEVEDLTNAPLTLNIINQRKNKKEL